VTPSPLDVTTVRGQAREAATAAPPELALTLLWHPDPARVGDVAFLGPLERASTGLSRLEPELAPPAGGAGAPLTDPHLSRTPLKLRGHAGGVRLTPATAGDAVVDGAPLDAPRELDAAALAAGVVIVLADRAALLLHLRRRPTGAPRHGLIGDSEAIDRVRADITRIADLDVPVLLCGPTGAGKELVARAIHAASKRAGGRFVGVNLSSLPAGLAGAALFGHARGAFTGAAAAHDGYLVQASGGTLLLDEIAEAPVELQAMLLRALEDDAVQPLGESQPRTVDVRWIAATDADLDAACRDGRFREPLRHRLAGFELPVPPLDARRDDIGRLVLAFARDELAAAGEPDRLADPAWLPAPLVAALARRPWPGNVRELRNAVRALVIAGRGSPAIALDTSGRLRALLGSGPHYGAMHRSEEAPSADRMLDALRENGWRIGATAAALGISRTTLYAWMEKSEGIRKARDVGRDEIVACLGECDGQVEAAAARLEVSPRGLRLRMKELGVAG
jgi:two-component system, NtrC family, nitrogen regulation response regulator GlnG